MTFRLWLASQPVLLLVMITSLGYVFTSFYLRDLSFNSDGVHSLGPFVAAGERIG